MRLYVSPREIEPLKQALRDANPHDAEKRQRQLAVLERIVLCAQLQKNCEIADKT